MSMAETLTRAAKKQQVKIGKTTTLHVHHLFFCTFRSLPSLHDMPNLRRDKNKKAARQRFSFPFLNFDKVFLNSTPEKIAKI